MSTRTTWHHRNGWFDRDQVHLAPASSSAELVRSYLDSPEFLRFFVPAAGPAVYEHGPFRREGIDVSHFRLLSPAELVDVVKDLRQPPDFYHPSDDAEWLPIEQEMSTLAATHQWALMLTLNETDSKYFHDWGGCFQLFREFLFANAGSGQVERRIIGYD